MSHWSDYHTPRIIQRDALLLLNAYLIFEDPSVDKFLNSELGSQKREGADYEFIKHCRNNHPNWEDRFIHCKTFAIATGNLCDDALSADDVLKKLDHYVHSKRLEFQAYHLIVVDQKHYKPGIYDEYKREFVRLRVMQFQRDWGAKEKKQEDLQRIGWANGKAWAHEVKNYTGLISATLMPLQRAKMSDKEDVLARVKRATQGLLILNAVSYAVQLAFAQRSGAVRTEDRNSLKKLPRDNALVIVEAILQYLLNFYAEAKQSEFNLTWINRISAEEAIQNLRSLMETPVLQKRERDDEVLTNRNFVWVIALLREVIGNIRLASPVGNNKLVQISYQLSLTQEQVVVTIIQEQIEWAFEPKKLEDPEGVRMANDLFGKQDGAGFGEIEVKKPILVELEDQSYKIRLEVEVRVAIA